MACTFLLGAEPTRANGTTFYGIDNNNNIYEVNPLKKSNTLVNQVGLSIPNCASTPGCLSIAAGSNGIAYDTARDHLFFFYNPTATGASAGYDLRFWNRKSSGIGSLQTIDLGETTNIPANAAYYNNALWYFGGGSATTALNKLELTYNPTQDAIDSWVLKTYDLATFAEPRYSPGTYGDIAINAIDGILYGSTTNGNYYSVDLNRLDDPAKPEVYTDLGTITSLQGATFETASQTATGLQLSFNADYSKLYGTRFCNAVSNCTGYSIDGQPISPAAGDGLFFEIANYAIGDSTTTRELTDADLLYVTSPGFRDLGGATDDPIGERVPGPLPVLGAGAAFAWSRKLRSRHRSRREG